jgi:hypothetical protein
VIDWTGVGLVFAGAFIGGLFGWLIGTMAYPRYAGLLRRWVGVYTNDPPGSDTADGNLALYRETLEALGEEAPGP